MVVVSHSADVVFGNQQTLKTENEPFLGEIRDHFLVTTYSSFNSFLSYLLNYVSR
jgi:hypothetical protein